MHAHPRSHRRSTRHNPRLGINFLSRIRHKKCDRALRTETTFNDTHDFGIGRGLDNLQRLLSLGVDINRRLLELERQSRRPAPAAQTFEQLVLPTGDSGRRAPGLRFGDPRVVALFNALSQFRWVLPGLQ